jgi:6-phosphogluconolactonase
MTHSPVEVLPTLDALIERAEVWLVDAIRAHLAAQDRCTFAVSGGSTPKPLYERLARQGLPWDKIHIFWGDERYVPPDHPDSNEGMVRHAWLNHIPIPSENIHPMPTLAGNPMADADRYAQELQTFFQLAPDEWPALDLVLLGMGDDGHTASLFPGTAVLQERDRTVGVGYRGADPRITLTLPTLNAAKTVLFLVAGANKQSALQNIFAEHPTTIHPAGLIQPQGQLLWMLDQAAAAGLSLPASP